MRITRIRLAGFKSFVDPVDLRILPGLTGIVGPNGCGKSNLLEAIRWAMGEGSPKSLRGGAMDDVIFAGTASRPQRQFAEVSIVAQRDTQEGDDEIEVVRRIERGAGSAYRINGRDARARDAQLLFADAATGAHSPALVSQGRIGAIIAARPAERRTMLEEAAGIAGLHVRRREAEIRLKATEANLARVADGIAEVDARVIALRRQARSAERYRRLSAAIRVAEGRLVYARWRDAAAAAEVARSEAAEADARVGQAAEAQRCATVAIRETAATLAAARHAAQTARDATAEARQAAATAESDLRAVDSRIATLAAERVRLRLDRERESELSRDAGDALTRLADEVAQLDARLADAGPNRQRDADGLAVAETRARDAELALAQATAAAAERGAQLHVADAALTAARAVLERVTAEASKLAAEAASLSSIDAAATAVEAADETRRRAERCTADVSAQLDRANAAREAAVNEVTAAQTAYAATAAALVALESEARALAPAIETKGALGRVTAARGYEAALAAALAEDLSADVGAAGDGRRWTGAAVEASDPPLTAGPPLADYVIAPTELARRLAQIAVVERDDGAPLAVGQRLVTRDGRLRRWDGFVSTSSGAVEAERLVRRNRLAELDHALVPSRAQCAAADAALQAARARSEATGRDIASARAEREMAEAATRRALRDADAAAAALDRARFDHERIADRQSVVATEHDEALIAMAEAAARRDALPLDDTSLLLPALSEAAQTARSAAADARTALAQLEARQASDCERRALAITEAQDWTQRGGKAGKRIEEMARRAAVLDDEAATLADAPADARHAVVRTRDATDAALSTAESALAAERAAEVESAARERAHATIAETLATAREARAGAVARAENQDLRRVEMGRVSGERFECPPPLLPKRLGFDADDVGLPQSESARLETLTADRERLGPVNLVAEQELLALEAGRAAQAAEVAELTEATHRLRGSIGSLNREGRIKLRAAFEAVDTHFRRLFQTLFNGGEAHLDLVYSDDPLDAGLEIMAQPPGKKLASLTLLSGGEQALTAVALIFALFLTNPAPLCVLDEVDAPLDDANVERFCDLLDAMARDTDTRFLIVTHNAVTMSRLDRLYGVTMIEAGISRLVSVDLGGAEALLAAE